MFGAAKAPTHFIRIVEDVANSIANYLEDH